MVNSKLLKFNITLPFSRSVQSEAGAAGEEAPDRKEPVGLTVCGWGCQPVAGHGENAADPGGGDSSRGCICRSGGFIRL